MLLTFYVHPTFILQTVPNNAIIAHWCWKQNPAKKKKHVNDMFFKLFFFIIIVFAHIRKHLPAISLCLFCIICAYVFAL